MIYTRKDADGYHLLTTALFNHQNLLEQHDNQLLPGFLIGQHSCLFRHGLVAELQLCPSTCITVKGGASPSTFHNDQVTLVSLELSGRMDFVKHTGGCHCGAVRFEVMSSSDLHVFHCNCSICIKKQNHHFIVPKNNFTLLQGSDLLTTYTFNTHVAKHTFCKICGVQSFYSPRSNPDGYGVAPHCLDPGSVRSVTIENFCGAQWEESMQAHKSISNMSKPVKDTDRE